MPLPTSLTAAKAAIIPHLKCPWMISWLVAGLVAIFVPVIAWSGERGKYFNYYGKAIQQQDYYEQQQEYYEQQQEYYEQQQNGNYYNGNNNDNNNNGQYAFKQCSWINWGCKKRQYNLAMYYGDGGNGDNVVQQLPYWYIYLGGETEDMQRWNEENMGERAQRMSNNSNPTMNFAYFLTIVLFLGLLALGAKSIAQKDIPLLAVTLVIAIVVAFMNLLMAASTLARDDERDQEDSYYGWYGQMGVLMVYTDFWIMLFSFGFVIAFQVSNFLKKKSEEKESNSGLAGEDYQAHEEKHAVV